jgi:hypothetical protein
LRVNEHKIDNRNQFDIDKKQMHSANKLP